MRAEALASSCPRAGTSSGFLLAVALGYSLLLSVSPAVAAVTEGRISTVSYLHQPLGTPEDPDPDRELDLITRLALNVRDLGHRSLSLYFYGSQRGELLVEGFDRSVARLYRGHLRYVPSPAVEFTLGRQWVYGGVGSSLVDGAQLRFRRPFGQLIVYGGNRGYLDPEGDTAHSLGKSGWDKSGIVGAFFRSSDIAGKVSFGLSAASTMWEGSEESDRLGFLASWRPDAQTSLFYENRYELNRKTSYYQHLRVGRNLPRRGFASLAWNRREGWLPEFHSSYIYNRFMNEAWFPASIEQPAQEIRGHVSLRPEALRGWRVALDVTELFPEDGDRGDGLAVFFDKSFSKLSLRFGYRAQRGYRGEQDGFFGWARYQVADRTRLWADLNRFSYSFAYEGLPDLDLSRHVTIAQRFGADHELASDWWISGALEALDYPGAKYEIRFLARVQYRFSLGSPAKEDQR